MRNYAIEGNPNIPEPIRGIGKLYFELYQYSYLLRDAEKRDYRRWGEHYYRNAADTIRDIGERLGIEQEEFDRIIAILKRSYLHYIDREFYEAHQLYHRVLSEIFNWL